MLTLAHKHFTATCVKNGHIRNSVKQTVGTPGLESAQCLSLSFTMFTDLLNTHTNSHSCQPLLLLVQFFLFGFHGACRSMSIIHNFPSGSSLAQQLSVFAHVNVGVCVSGRQTANLQCVHSTCSRLYNAFVLRCA